MQNLLALSTEPEWWKKRLTLLNDGPHNAYLYECMNGEQGSQKRFQRSINNWLKPEALF